MFSKSFSQTAKRWIGSFCGIIGFIGGMQIAQIDNIVLSILGSLLAIWGIYYFVRATEGEGWI